MESVNEYENEYENNPTQSALADVEFILDTLECLFGSNCRAEHEGFVRRAHAELLADSATSSEFESRFGTYLVELVGPTPG